MSELHVLQKINAGTCSLPSLPDGERKERERYRNQREKEIEERGDNRISYAEYIEIKHRADAGDEKKEVYHEVAKVVNLSAIEGATPSPFVYMLDGYGIKWSGKLLPSVSGCLLYTSRCPILEVSDSPYEFISQYLVVIGQ